MNRTHALENMIFQDYVEVYGLDDFKTSMQALENFTQGSSSEFAIRAFIVLYEDETMEMMKKWTQSENEHVRRLASEGCRPRLPWAMALENFKTDPTKVLEVLELLKDDTSSYVQKSVANAVNDISKDHPSKVKRLAKVWLKENTQRRWLVKHGCRTLLKQGDKELLSLFGFEKTHHLMLNNFRHTKQVKQG
jgi:3-methyladenine DNA glycosylase AlkC